VLGYFFRPNGAFTKTWKKKSYHLNVEILKLNWNLSHLFEKAVLFNENGFLVLPFLSV